MSSSNQRQINDLIKEMRKRGWTVTSGSKHWKAKHPKGDLITLPVSPSGCVRSSIALVKRVERKYES